MSRNPSNRLNGNNMTGSGEIERLACGKKQDAKRVKFQHELYRRNAELLRYDDARAKQDVNEHSGCGNSSPGHRAGADGNDKIPAEGLGLFTKFLQSCNSPLNRGAVSCVTYKANLT